MPVAITTGNWGGGQTRAPAEPMAVPPEEQEERGAVASLFTHLHRRTRRRGRRIGARRGSLARRVSIDLRPARPACVFREDGMLGLTFRQLLRVTPSNPPLRSHWLQTPLSVLSNWVQAPPSLPPSQSGLTGSRLPSLSPPLSVWSHWVQAPLSVWSNWVQASHWPGCSRVMSSVPLGGQRRGH